MVIIAHHVGHQLQIYGAEMSFFGSLGGIGSFLSGAGGLLGAFGVGRSGGPDVAGQQQFSMQQLQMQEQFQREMAQNSIMYRVGDAERAGISPLVALGAPTYSPSLQVGGVDYGASRSSGFDPASALIKAGGALGDIARTATQKETADAILEFQKQNAVKQGQLTDADIALKGAQAAYWAKRASEPSFPSVISDTGGMAGQANLPGRGGISNVTEAGGYRNEVPSVLTHTPGQPGLVSGRAGPADQGYWTSDGRLEIQPSAGSPASQGDIFNSAASFLRNRIMPNFNTRNNDPGIMEQIRQKYPDAVSYVHTGFGYYRPVFPEEQVREDIRRARIFNQR